MWHIIKAEIDRDKYTWYLACIPLIITIPILFFQGATWLDSDQATKSVINMGKGVAIIIALLTLRIFIGSTIPNPIIRRQMCLPISAFTLGFIRVFNLVGLLFTVFFLIALNILALKVEALQYISVHLLFGTGMLLSTFSLILIVSDLLSISLKMPLYRAHFTLLIVSAALFLLLKNRGQVFSSYLTLPIATLLNILGITLLSASIYTFTRLRSYIFKQTT